MAKSNWVLSAYRIPANTMIGTFMIKQIGMALFFGDTSCCIHNQVARLTCLHITRTPTGAATYTVVGI